MADCFLLGEAEAIHLSARCTAKAFAIDVRVVPCDELRERAAGQRHGLLRIRLAITYGASLRELIIPIMGK
jgi:hypothetical protein